MSTRLILAFVSASVLALAACGQTSTTPAPTAATTTVTAANPANPAPTVQTAGVPTVVGACVETTVSDVGSRLEGTPGSGSAIMYANGVSQVSYDAVPGIDHSHQGDPVRICLVSLPQNCPAGDDRGKVYSALNLRTHETWTESDSEHDCGGA